jgi:hypothetical protein
MLGVPSHHPRFELWVLSHTPTVNAVEELASGLVAMVGSARPLVYPSQFLHYLSTHFEVIATEVRVRHSWPDDFLVLFCNDVVADRVLHRPILSAADFLLIIR